MEAPFATYGDDLKRVREVMAAALLDGSPPFARHLLDHFPLEGGRGLRPSLVLAASSLRRSEGAKNRKRPPTIRALRAAAAIEMVHAGSLLHDDVVDEAKLRRHVPTINRLFGPREAVLLGDYFLARAFGLVLSLKIPRATSSFVRLMRAMVDGELLELRHNMVEPTEDDVTNIIRLKTGSLFAEACFLGGLVAGLDKAALERLRAFGQEAGCAYQMTDDLLDATSVSSLLGKDAGNDLLHGKPTLPLVLAMQLAPPELRAAFRDGGHHSSELAELLCDGRVRQHCMMAARAATSRACNQLELLPTSPARQQLVAFAVFASERAAR